MPQRLTALPWNVIDTIIALVDDIHTLGRLASMHSCFNTAAEHDPVWERLCEVRYPGVYSSFRHRFVDSWRNVMRRECTRAKVESMSKIVADGTVDGEKQQVVRRSVDLSFANWWSLGSDGIGRLALVLAGGSSLCTLNLGSQALSTADLDAVTTIVRNANSLETLVLDDNRLKGPDLGAKLQSLVRAGRRLRSLSLSSCRGIDRDAGIALADVIPSSSLDSLNLSETAVGSAVVALTAACSVQLESSDRPKRYRLDFRNVGAKGCEGPLAEALDRLSRTCCGKSKSLSQRTATALIDLRASAESRNPNQLSSRKVRETLTNASGEQTAESAVLISLPSVAVSFPPQKDTGCCVC